MSAVEALCVDPVHMPHQARQVGLPGVQHHVVVIAHQAIGQHLRVEAIHRLRDDLELRPPIRIVAIDRLASVATRGDVIDGAGELDAQRAAHGAKFALDWEKCKT